MLKNYFKVAIRNLWKYRLVSAINLIGLITGMTAAFLIFLFVKFEFTYDHFNLNADRIYRVACDIKTSSELREGSKTSAPMAPALTNEFPEIESFVRICPVSFIIHTGIVKFHEDNILFVDSSIFKVFTLPVIKGNKQSALNDPLSVVLSETGAKKYFGGENPIGKTIYLNVNNQPAIVTAVIKDFPQNAHFRADVLISMTTLTQIFEPELDKHWNNLAFYSYILVKENIDTRLMQAKFPDFLQRHIGVQMYNNNERFILSLEPLRKIYLYSEKGGMIKGSAKTVYIFSIVAIFILFITCINFINLTTARAAERAKEIGVRKLIGAKRKQLITQFLGESLLQCMMAFCFTVLICTVLIQSFNLLVGKIISVNIFAEAQNIGGLFLLSLFIGCAAGYYPALVLAALRPVNIIQGRFVSGKKGVMLRKILVVTQFTISIILIITTATVYNQVNFMLKQDIGFTKDQTILIDYYGDKRIELFKQDVATLPQVKSSSLSSTAPGFPSNQLYTRIESQSGEMITSAAVCYIIDFDFITTYGMKIVAGRGFSRQFGTDCPNAMIINETAVKKFGFRSASDALAKRFEQDGKKGTIIGVVKDFNFESLQQKIKPMTMRIEPDNNDCRLISLKLANKDLAKLIKDIRKSWTKLFDDRPFNYIFLDEAFNSQYQMVDRFGRLFLIFSTLAIIISCLGIFGLAAYTTVQRTLEIGIRKVFGASIFTIVKLLIMDFVRLVILSFIIATPIGGIIMSRWLQDFAYRVSLSWQIFIYAGIGAFLIAAMTVSYHALKAGFAKPVKSLSTA